MIPMQIEKTYTTLLKNRLYRRIDGFHCLLCNVILIDEKDAYNHITNNQKHAEHMSSELVENLRIDDEKSVELVNNGIIPISDKGYECTFCSCLVPNLDHVPEHIYSKKHKLQCQIVSTFNFCNANTMKDQESVTLNDKDSCHGEKNEINSCYSSSIHKEKEYQDEDLNVQNYNQLTNLSKNKNKKSYSPCKIVNQNNEERDCCFNENEKEVTVNVTEQDYIIESINNLEGNLIENNIERTSANNSHCDQSEYKEDLHTNLLIHEYHESKHELNFNDPLNNFYTVYCNICNDTLGSESALLYHRMFHLSQRTFVSNDIIHFSMKQNIKNIYCLVCNYFMQTENDLERHLNDVLHQKRMHVLGCPNSNAITNTMYSTMYPNFTVPTNNIYNTYSTEFNRYICYSGSQTLPGTSVHIGFNSDHQMMSAVVPVQQQFFNYPMLPNYFCFVCCIKFLDENQLFSHYVYDQNHKYRMDAIQLIKNDANIEFTMYINMPVLKCLKCQVYFTEVNIAIYHIFEMQHIMNQGSYNTVSVNSVNKENYVCPICKVNEPYDYLMVEHLESDYHKNKVKDYYTNINCESFEKVIFFCPVCKMNFFSDNILLEHFYIDHQKRCSNVIQNNVPSQNNVHFISTYNNANCQEVEQQYCIQKIPSNRINSIVNNSNSLMQNHQSQTAKNELKTFNRTCENINSINTTSTKNLLNFSPRYVKLCVETGEENIFKINQEKVKKLHLSISLTFPYDSNRVCIPCGSEISSDPQLLYEHLRTEEHEKNLQEIEEYDKLFEKYREQFSDLELAKEFICEDSEEWVKCYTCDDIIENCNVRIKDHIESELHKANNLFWKQSAEKISNFFDDMFENIWYYIEKFFCNICCSQFDFEVDYARHLENQKHLEVEKKILKKQSLQFDCCIICSSYWYGKSDHHKIHCSKDSHKYILISRDFNVPEMPEASKHVLGSIEDTIKELMKESNEVVDSKGITEGKLLESVEVVVRSKYANAKAHLFGSRISYLGVKDSDLDIYLDCENQYEKLNSKDESQEQLLIVQECFHKYQDIWVIEEIIVRTRVPIIKVRHRHTNLNCHISFVNGLSVEKSKILGYFTNACLPCRKLILYLRKWSTLCRLSVTRGLTTFAMAWLVIFYLQIKGILPSVWHLIQLNNQSSIIAGWETGIFKVVPVENTELSIKDLVQGFFSYYAEFDYISNVACPFLGKVMKKSQFSHIDDLPEEMNMYKSQIREEKIEFFRLDSPMCIQEPIDLSQNLTKAVSKLHLRMFRQYCTESARFLENIG